MRNRVLVAGLAVAMLGAAGRASASGPILVVGVIDKVVFEPADGPAARAQVWGSFCATRDGGRTYGTPQYGFYYYAVEAPYEQECRKAWMDLKKAAGTGQVLAWGDTSDAPGAGRLRRVQRPGDPDPMPLGGGVMKFRADSRFAAVQALLTTPAAIGPAPGDTVPDGKVHLVVRNVRGPAPDTYRFELTGADGKKELSPEIKPGELQTGWSPEMEVKAGQEYRWRAWAIRAGTDLPAAKASFTVKGKP